LASVSPKLKIPTNLTTKKTAPQFNTEGRFSFYNKLNAANAANASKTIQATEYS
jgi:hypothetical protein